MNTETQQPHFDEEAINRFLSNEFTDEEARRFEQHLDACEPCQQRMTKLSANHWGWGDVSSSLEADEFDLPEETSGRAAQYKHDAQASGSDAATDSLAGASSLYSSTSDDDPATTSGILKREISGWLDPTDEPHMLGRFAGYEIVGIIGHGGMGIVLKGFEPRLNRFVAIKILAPRLASSGAARKRFEREARAAAAVLHDNVIAIHRVDYWHDLPFLVMPYIAGESLQQRIDREGPLEVEAVLRIGQQIAAGLSAAHAQGLVHRDIKPANILLDKGVERVTITDFGLARASDDAVITQTGFVAGTPQYMSPEQASGLPIDHRSDLFSLGSVMYAMAAGRPPFSANENLLLLKKIRETPAPGIQQVEESVPLWLANLIGWCHGKSLEDRPESASAIEQHLADWLAHLKRPDQVKAPAAVAIPSTQPADVPPPNRFRRKLLAGFAGFLFLCAAVLVIVETSTGKIRIECEGDNVPVVVKKSGQVYDKLTVNRDGATIRAFAGEYEVTFAGDFDSLSGFDLSGPDGSFALKRGKETVIRITQVDESDAASNNRSGSRQDFRRVTDSDPASTELRLYSVGNYITDDVFSIDNPIKLLYPNLDDEDIIAPAVGNLSEPHFFMTMCPASSEDNVKVRHDAEKLIALIREKCGVPKSIRFLAESMQLAVNADNKRHQQIEDLFESLVVDQRDQIEVEVLMISTEWVDAKREEEIKRMIVSQSLSEEQLKQAREWCRPEPPYDSPPSFMLRSGKTMSRKIVVPVTFTARLSSDNEIQIRYDQTVEEAGCVSLVHTVKFGEAMVCRFPNTIDTAFLIIPKISSPETTGAGNVVKPNSVLRRLVQVKPQVADHVTLNVPGLGMSPGPSGRILLGDGTTNQIEVSDHNKLITTGSLEILPVTEASRAYLAHNDITVQITSEDLEHLKEGNGLVTAMYLPKDGSRAIAGVDTMVTTRIDPSKDTVAEAKKRGTLLAVLRLGGIEAQQENLTSTTTTDGDSSSEPLPTYSGRNIVEWLEHHATSASISIETDKAFEILGQDGRNDAFVVKELDRRLASAKRELNPILIDQEAELVVRIAGRRHQESAVDILMQLADVRALPKDLQVHDVEVPFAAAVRRLHLNRELALQISSQVTSSGRRVLASSVLMQAMKEEDDVRSGDVSEWMRENGDLLLPAFIAGIEDPESIAAWCCTANSCWTRASFEPGGVDSEVARWKRRPIDDKLEELLSKVIKADFRRDISPLVAQMLFAIAPENPVLREALVDWARSPEQKIVLQSIHLLTKPTESSIANLCTLLEDDEWGTGHGPSISRYDQNFTTCRTLVLAFLSTSGKSGEGALEILRKESQSSNKRQKELATKAIQAIEAAIKKP